MTFKVGDLVSMSGCYLYTFCMCHLNASTVKRAAEHGIIINIHHCPITLRKCLHIWFGGNVGWIDEIFVRQC
jgi:hypothetical protein